MWMNQYAAYLKYVLPPLFLGLVIAFVLFFRSCENKSTPQQASYIIARSSGWQMFNLRGLEKNMLGFTQELIREMARTEEFEAKIVEINFQNLLNDLINEEVDAILTTPSPAIKLRRGLLLSEPFYPIGPVLIVEIDSPAKKLEDLKERTVGVVMGTFLGPLQKEDAPLFMPYDSALEALEDLDRNLLSGVLLDSPTAYAYTLGIFQGRLKVVTPPLIDQGLHLVAREEPKGIQLVSRFNEGLKKMKASGLYERMLDKWGLINPEKTPLKVNSK